MPNLPGVDACFDRLAAPTDECPLYKRCKCVCRQLLASRQFDGAGRANVILRDMINHAAV
jgi:hypothetical protein